MPDSRPIPGSPGQSRAAQIFTTNISGANVNSSIEDAAVLLEGKKFFLALGWHSSCS